MHPEFMYILFAARAALCELNVELISYKFSSLRATAQAQFATQAARTLSKSLANADSA